MRTNKLKLHDDKTDVVLFDTRQQLKKLESNEEIEIKIGCEIIFNQFHQQEILAILWNPS